MLQDLPPSGGPVACCSVLIAGRLLLCHEDVETNFLRTLAAANVIDITSVNTDADMDSYCVLVSVLCENKLSHMSSIFMLSAVLKFENN